MTKWLSQSKHTYLITIKINKYKTTHLGKSPASLAPKITLIMISITM